MGLTRAHQESDGDKGLLDIKFREHKFVTGVNCKLHQSGWKARRAQSGATTGGKLSPIFLLNVYCLLTFITIASSLSAMCRGFKHLQIGDRACLHENKTHLAPGMRR